MGYMRATFRMMCLGLVIASLFLTSLLISFLERLKVLRLFTKNLLVGHSQTIYKITLNS